MKKILILAVCLLTTISSFAQSGKAIYNKYSEAPGVSAVYISPAMFRLIGQIPDMDLGDEELNITPLIETLNGFYLIDSENTEINNKLFADVKKFVDNGDYELLMEVKDEGEVVNIYISGNDEIITGFVMLVYEADECTFICFDGKMQKEQLIELLSSEME